MKSNSFLIIKIAILFLLTFLDGKEWFYGEIGSEGLVFRAVRFDFFQNFSLSRRS